MQSTLLLWLQGPFQSYGYNSMFDIRDTALFPTKSAICGMICSAMGKDGEQEDFLKKLVVSPLNIVAYTNKDCNYSIAKDFQTIGTNYDPNDKFELAMIPKTASNAKPSGSTGAVLTSKNILEGLYFACTLKYDIEFAKKIYEALVEPIYTICLGRKAYIPSDFIAQGLFNNDQELNNKLESLIEEKSLRKVFSVEECIDGDYLLNDVPLCFGMFKRYSARRVDIKGLDEDITL